MTPPSDIHVDLLVLMWSINVFVSSVAHARKGESLVALSKERNIFQIFQNIQNSLFNAKISFFVATLLRFTFPFQFQDGGSSSCTATL